MIVSIAENRDCMDAMREFSDGYFDLACVDPPYGSDGIERTGHGWADKFGKKINEWDVAPKKEYFDELFRVSRNQIIWGGNYFYLPPTRCFLVWRKTHIPADGFSMSPIEYAWTSFNENAAIVELFSRGFDDHFHPTQKPVSLYKWILQKYAKPGDKIIDTHLGSGSSRIAAYDAGLDFYGYEIDKEYFESQEKRFANHTRQIRFDFEQ